MAQHLLSEYRALERRLLDKFLHRDGHVFSLLRKQSEHLSVTNRLYTNVGFNVKYAININDYILPNYPNFHIGDVFGTSSDVAHGVGFVLFIKDGNLSSLEGYTFDEDWPRDLNRIELHYDNSESAKL